MHRVAGKLVHAGNGRSVSGTVHASSYDHSVKHKILAIFNLQYPFTTDSISFNFGHAGAESKMRPEMEVVGVAFHVIGDLRSGAVRRRIAREWKIRKTVLRK